jgi:hypothetical protein
MVAEIRRFTRATYHRTICTVYTTKKTQLMKILLLLTLTNAIKETLGQRLRSLDVKLGRSTLQMANLCGTKCGNLCNSLISSESELEAIYMINLYMNVITGLPVGPL